MKPPWSSSSRTDFTLYIYALALALLLLAQNSFAQTAGTKWNDLIGMGVVDVNDKPLGWVTDTAIDLEHGRCLAYLISSGGVLGLGRNVQFVPPGAVTGTMYPRILRLKVTEAQFRQAPSFKTSDLIGPPNARAVAEVYRYYGQPIYFATEIVATPTKGQPREQLGFVQRGTKLYGLPVENLQGRLLGQVTGIRDLNMVDGRIAGIIINPAAFGLSGDLKIVESQDLRYNPAKTRLILNDHEQEFINSADFSMTHTGNFREEAPARPGSPVPPLVQGNSRSDKNITSEIRSQISADSTLSHYARNIQVATVKGKTIVRGRVETNRDRDQIFAYAAQFAGRENVTNQMEVRAITNWEKNIDAPSSPAMQSAL